ncbi:MAG: hypothetical protein KC656_32510, partial [Myxococcales bacterium]|nr:hypothetical protein [Myxococcales bacterium]
EGVVLPAGEWSCKKLVSWECTRPDGVAVDIGPWSPRPDWVEPIPSEVFTPCRHPLGECVYRERVFFQPSAAVELREQGMLIGVWGPEGMPLEEVRALAYDWLPQIRVQSLDAQCLSKHHRLCELELPALDE